MDDAHTLLVTPMMELRTFSRGTAKYCSTKCALRSESGSSCKLRLNASVGAVGGDYMPLLQPSASCPMHDCDVACRSVSLTMTEP